MKLMEPYYGRRYNVTTDNFFTSAELAKKVLDKRTSLVGTLRLNRKEIPSVCTKMLNQSINEKFVGRRYTTRPGAPTVVSGKHDQKVHS